MQFKQLILNSIFWRGLYFFTVLSLNIVVAQLLGASLSGAMYYLTNFFSLILLLAGLSLESGVGFFAAQKKITERKLVTFSLVWSVFIMSIVVLILYRLDEQPGMYFNRNQFLFMAVTYISGLLLVNFFVPLFYARANYFLPNAVMAVCNLALIIIGIGVYLLSKGQQKQDTYLSIYFIGFAVQGVLVVVFYCYKINLGFSFDFPNKSELLMLFRYSLVALLANLTYFLLYRIDYWFIQHTSLVYPVNELNAYLGNYIQVSKIGQLFMIVPGILANTIFPNTAAGFKEQVYLRLPTLIKTVLIIYTFIFVILAISGSWLFPWLYGPTYTHMYIPFLMLMPGILSLSVVSLLSAYNSGNNKISLNLYGAAIGLLIIILGDWLFIPKYGIIAAAVVSTTGYLSYLIFLLYYFKKEYKLSITNLIMPGKQYWLTIFNMRSSLWK